MDPRLELDGLIEALYVLRRKLEADGAYVSADTVNLALDRLCHVPYTDGTLSGTPTTELKILDNNPVQSF